jgi:hypothetical protein
VATRWSDDAFLDSLRSLTDEVANECVRRLVAEGGLAHAHELFRALASNDSPVPDAAPAALREFLGTAPGLPPATDLDRLRRGSEVWMSESLPAALVLLTKALPEGYAAPSFGVILNMSGDLERHPYRRLLGVLQMVVNVCERDAFSPRGRAVVTAHKMRLLHAAMRVHIVPKCLPRYDAARLGPPINMEDMLATLMGFSWVVLAGLRELGTPLRREQEEDLYYVWRTFARMVGIHPPGQPESDELVPASVPEAEEFYAAFCRRHYVGPEANPDGVALARANLEMLQGLLPARWRAVGLGIVPRIYMQDLIGREGCARVGIEPVAGHALLRAVLLGLVRVNQRLIGGVPERVDATFGRLLFGRMIGDTWKVREVTWTIPDTIEDVRRLA